MHVLDDLKNHQYYRSILMVIDKNAERDDALKAHAMKESMTVELGLITINFSALPQAIIDDIRKGSTPFGALLITHQIKTQSAHQRYFKISCDKSLNTYLSCKDKDFLYGRTNTIIRDDNREWIANVVEILR